MKVSELEVQQQVDVLGSHSQSQALNQSFHSYNKAPLSVYTINTVVSTKSKQMRWFCSEDLLE